MNRPIGIIDSGVGGLTVAKKVIELLPNEEIIYIGDAKRCPYGPRPRDEVREYTWQMINRLLDKDIKLLVIACNTATAVVLEEARRELSIPVIGVIEPGAIAAMKATSEKYIGVIGTSGTIKSEAYEKALKSIDSLVKVESLACPNFVPLVEAGIFSGNEARETVKEELKPLLLKHFDTLILGCTHYPLLSNLIQQVVGPDIKLISSGEETANEARKLLYQTNTAAINSSTRHTFYTTGDIRNFKKIGEDWLGFEMHQVDTIRLSNLVEV